jgi:L-histidine N-alpha-methyltransferase
MPARPETVRIGHVVVDVHLEEETPERVLRQIRADLLRTPREIAPRFFYDDRGSELFERITELPEYYQTRTERALLRAISGDVARRCGCPVLVELGSGASSKTRVLLDALTDAHGCEVYVPFDVSEGIVRRAADELASEYPGLSVHAVVGDFTHHLEHIPSEARRLIIFLGGTIGNFTPTQARDFLTRVAGVMQPDEYFLLGVDLIKDVATLEAAYNDSQGVTAAFNRNILNVVNGVADGDFVPEAFEHRAFFDAAQHRIDLRLVSHREQSVRLRSADLLLLFREGDEIRTEISVKYDQGLTRELLRACGLELVEWYTDPKSFFGLALARRPSSGAAG